MVASLRQYASATLKDSIVVGLSTAVLDDPLRKNKGTTDSSGKANGDGDLAGDASDDDEDYPNASGTSSWKRVTVDFTHNFTILRSLGIKMLAEL